MAQDCQDGIRFSSDPGVCTRSGRKGPRTRKEGARVVKLTARGEARRRFGRLSCCALCLALSSLCPSLAEPSYSRCTANITKSDRSAHGTQCPTKDARQGLHRAQKEPRRLDRPRRDLRYGCVTAPRKLLGPIVHTVIGCGGIAGGFPSVSCILVNDEYNIAAPRMQGCMMQTNMQEDFGDLSSSTAAQE